MGSQQCRTALVHLTKLETSKRFSMRVVTPYECENFSTNCSLIYISDPDEP